VDHKYISETAETTGSHQILYTLRICQSSVSLKLLHLLRIKRFYELPLLGVIMIT